MKKRILVGTVHYLGDEQGLIQWENGEVSREELPPEVPRPFATPMQAHFDTKTKQLLFCYSSMR
jgi:hypothetical protein